MNECPHKSSLSALQAAIHAKETEEEQEPDEGPSHMGVLRFLGAVEKHTKPHKECQEKGLMFVDAHINGKIAKSVMIDT